MRLMNQQTEFWGSTWFSSDTDPGCDGPGQPWVGIQASQLFTKCRESKIGHAYMVGGFNHEFYFPSYIGNHGPNWLSHFSEGWLNHQPVMHVHGVLICRPKNSVEDDSVDGRVFFQDTWLKQESVRSYPEKHQWLITPSGKVSHNYGKSQFSMGKYGTSTISMAIFNSYFDITRGYIHIYCLMSRLP